VATSIIFALVLLVPKLLRLRQNKRCWMAFRVLLATTGTLLVLQPLTLVNPWLPGIIGLLMFLTAILLPPATGAPSVADKARELGALVVVNGGEFQSERSPAVAVSLFVGVDQIDVLDRHLQPLLVIPLAQVLSVAVAQTHDRWVLRINSADHSTEFSYRGAFAEHLARVAESTLRSVVPFFLPVIPQQRAAGV
jgi:hypothetical protein